jgi:hypothetical protein
MIGSIVYLILSIFLLGVIESISFYFIQKQFDFKFPQRDIDNRISIKKLKLYLCENKISNVKLLKYLKFIIFLDLIIQLLLSILLLYILWLLISNLFFK